MAVNNPAAIALPAVPEENLPGQAARPPIPCNTIIAVIVTFNPDHDTFTRLLEALLPQVAGTVVVDNASSLAVTGLLAGRTGHQLELLQLSENSGIAAAQNAGIKRALERAADCVLLLDQDSIPGPSMVAELRAAFLSASKDSPAPPIAAVGPARVDGRTGTLSFFLVCRCGLPRPWQPAASGTAWPSTIETDFLMASGSLVPLTVFQAIGAMRTNYFIDHVDREWCFRAKAAGYRLLGVPTARLEHAIGDLVTRRCLFRTRALSWHPPLRNYYLYRNALLLQRDVPMSWRWRVYFCWRLLRYACGVLFLAQDRRVRMRLMLQGLSHGFRGISGRLDPATSQCVVLPAGPLDPDR